MTSPTEPGAGPPRLSLHHRRVTDDERTPRRLPCDILNADAESSRITVTHISIRPRRNSVALVTGDQQCRSTSQQVGLTTNCSAQVLQPWPDSRTSALARGTGTYWIRSYFHHVQAPPVFFRTLSLRYRYHTLVESSGAGHIPAVRSGLPLSSSNSVVVSCREPSPDIWRRHSTPSAFCWHSHADGIVHQTLNDRRPCLPMASARACMEQPAVVCQEWTVADDVPFDVPSRTEDCTFSVVIRRWLGDRDRTAQYNCCLPATTDCRRFCRFV